MSARTFFVFLGGFLCSARLFFGSVQNISNALAYRWETAFSSPQEEKPVQSDSSYEAKEKYVYDVLRERYYDKDHIDLQVMRENALKGFVDAIGDPHTEYLTKEENTIFEEGMEGTQHFEGIGAVVSKKKDGIMISEVLKGSPAFEAGLQPLDIIVRIEEESTQEMTLSEAVQKIRGPKGTAVKLSVFRQRNEYDEVQLLDISVTRGTIDVPSVKATLLPVGTGHTAHIEVAIFGEDTIVKLQQALLQLSNYQSVILDLRGNGGGYLPTAVQLASFFLPKNEIVTTAKYTVLPEEVFRSEGYGTFAGKPVVVLVDGMSASASEIVAGALQQRGRAKVVGTTSFGKGSIQTLEDMDDGSMLKYTIGKWYLPNDTTIDKIGITPDVEVPFDRDAFTSGGVDNQIQKAIELLNNPTYREVGCCNG